MEKSAISVPYFGTNFCETGGIMYENIDGNTLITPKEIAAVLKITGRRVRQLSEDGILHKTDGSYNLADTVEDFYRNKYKGTANIEDAKLDMAMKKANVQLKASKAQIARLEAEELQGKMHRADDVEVITSDMVFAIRSALNALPGRLAMEVVHVETAAEAAQIIRKEVNLVMNELANYQYDPEKYQERVRDRMEWEAKQDDDED